MSRSILLSASAATARRHSLILRRSSKAATRGAASSLLLLLRQRKEVMYCISQSCVSTCRAQSAFELKCVAGSTFVLVALPPKSASCVLENTAPNARGVVEILFFVLAPLPKLEIELTCEEEQKAGRVDDTTVVYFGHPYVSNKL